MGELLKEKIKSIIRQNSLEFSFENFFGLKNFDYGLGIEFARNNIKMLCEGLKEGQYRLKLATVESLLEFEHLTSDECRVIISASDEPVKVWPSFNCNAISILLEKPLDQSEFERLPDIWENSDNIVKEQIKGIYLDLAKNNSDLGTDIPSGALKEILGSKNLTFEFRKQLLAESINRLDREGILESLALVGLHHFRGVVSGAYPKKMTKTPCYKENKEIAEQLKLKGLISSWRDDWNNPNFTWVYGLKE